MDNAQMIEGYLIDSGMAYDAVGDGLWIVHDESEHVDNIVIHHSHPIVVFRVKLMDAPGDAVARAALFEDLLRLNATDMVSGAYGLEDNAVVITETLQAENLDENEFQAALDGITLGIAQHYPTLKSHLSA